MLNVFILSTLNIKEMGFESQSLKREFYNLFTFDYSTIMRQSKWQNVSTKFKVC